jgi:predicted regulator of Ras-like GTPase activity (Roadblock/LC7/MglB family)
MSRIHEIVTDLQACPGVKGALVLTQDGLVAASALREEAAGETLAGMASWLAMTAGKVLREGGMGGMSRLWVHATHGKAVLVDLGKSCLVVMLDQFADPERTTPEIDDAVLRIRRASRLG